VHFVPNEMQLKFLDEMWYLNCILKARQHGFTTLITLWILDECLFYPNQTAGVIAHNLEDGAKIFRTKIKHPYDRLLPGLRDRIPAQNDRAQELVFGNKSSIAVSTSTRSGTCQYLLITEFGKIAAKFPEKANEIVSGAFNTVHPGNYLFVESSAEGRSGQFYDLCKRSEDAKVAEKPLSKMDFKFHFYSWWENPKYVLSAEDAKNVVFTKAHHEYFDKLARQHGIKLTFEQMAFYIKKREMNGGDLIKREYPSTSKEAFEASIIGAYFGEQMAEAREKGRICKVPHVKGVGVDTWWDLGLRDKMAVWFVQVVGREARFINYTEKSDRSLTWFLTVHLPAIKRSTATTTATSSARMTFRCASSRAASRAGRRRRGSAFSSRSARRSSSRTSSRRAATSSPAAGSTRRCAPRASSTWKTSAKNGTSTWGPTWTNRCTTSTATARAPT
jgi:hypothetical protein